MRSKARAIVDSCKLIEPVMIAFEDIDWVHPDIEELLVWEVDGLNAGKWSYDGLTRVYIENDKKQTAYMVFLSDDLEDGRVSQEELYAATETALFEDVWMPGDHQFCFSELGLKMAEAFGRGNMSITFASPDVGVEDEGDSSYSWSS